MIEINQGDTLPTVEYQLQRNGEPVDVYGTSVKFLMKRLSDGEQVLSKKANIRDGPSGKVEYRWDSEDTEKTGKFKCEFQVTYNNDRIETFPKRESLYVKIA